MAQHCKQSSAQDVSACVHSKNYSVILLRTNVWTQNSGVDTMLHERYVQCDPVSRCVNSYNIGKIKRKIKITPPHFNDEKMACFALCVNLSLTLGGGGFNFLFFYSVQDCSWLAFYAMLFLFKVTRSLHFRYDVRFFVWLEYLQSLTVYTNYENFTFLLY